VSILELERKVNTLDEKWKLYWYIMERVEKLRAMEKSAGGMPLPETRENIALALALLDRIRAEAGEEPESSDEKRDKVFGKWMKQQTSEK
jgi:hypothetical protein